MQGDIDCPFSILDSQFEGHANVQYVSIPDGIPVADRHVFPQDISGHHTFNVDPGTVLDLDLGPEGKDMVPLLDEAQDSSNRPKAIAVGIDDESAHVFRVRDYGLESL